MEDKQQSGFDQLKQQRGETSRIVVNIIMPVLSIFIPVLFGLPINIICTISSIYSLMKDKNRKRAIMVFALNVIVFAFNILFIFSALQGEI